MLYNFVNATSSPPTASASGARVLAPYANVTFNDGSWDGGLYARSLSGNAEGHINALNESNICL